ncbi:MAG TPA: protein kinase, partial [Bacteroidota bacterium]|nr:protein kinase [Bacteroidota bacterium]
LRGTISRITKAGSTVGTAGYMSPEQVQGLDADHRSDIFSLGVMLYELLTGRLPFKGVHETALMYEIVNVEAEPMSAVNPGLDPELDRIVYECLQKDPEERYQSVKEISRDLKRFRRESSKARMSRTFPAQSGTRIPGTPAGVSSASMPAGVITPGSGVTEKPSREWLIWSAGAFIAGLAVIAFLWQPWRVPDTPSEPVTRVTIRFSDEVLIPIGTQGIEISPNGKFMSLVVQSGLEGKLYLRPSDRESLEPVLGSSVPAGQVYYHHFSPDGEWIAFCPGNTIKKASVFGGAAVNVCDVGGQPRGLWWGTDGYIYFGHISSVIYGVSASGGVPEPVTTLDSSAGEISHRFPALLPDGKSVLYTIKFNNITTFEEAAIAVLDMKSGKKKTLIRGGSYARYASTGHIIYVKGSYLYAVPFDLKRMEVTGPPKKLFKGGWMNPFSGDANVSFTNNGTLLYIPRGIESYSVSRIKWIDFQGNTSPLVDTTNAYWVAALSPDGEKLALHVQAANDDIWVYHIGRKSLTRLTFGGGNSGSPVWGSDGKYIIYSAERGVASNIYRKAWDGSGGEQRLTNTGKSQYPRSLSADGKTLSFIQDGDIWMLDLGGGGTSFVFLETPAVESDPVFSPDSRYLAYESNESGRYEVYIVSYPSKSGKWQISSGGGTNPIWNPSGNILYFAQGTSIQAVDIRAGAAFDFSAPRRVLDLPPEGAALTGISPDGKRFAMVTLPYAELGTSEVTLVTEWFTELKNAFAGQ